MSLILSLQGSMAVGKTTAVKYIQSHAPYINISYEENNDIVEQVKLRSLDKNTLYLGDVFLIDNSNVTKVI